MKLGSAVQVVLIAIGMGTENPDGPDRAERRHIKRRGFLTRDPREKESKKYGRKRARKRFQFSKR